MDSNKICGFLASDETTASADVLMVARSLVAGLAGPDGSERWKTHPLGFFHAAEDVSPGVQFRVHVWPKGWSVPAEQVPGEIHDHIFQLRSLVLCGAIQNETFNMTEDPNGEYRLLPVEYGPTASHVTSCGRSVRLDRSSCCVYGIADVYGLAAGILHRSSAIRTPAITLVRTARAVSVPYPVVAVHGSEAPPPIFERHTLNSIAHDLLLEAVKCLG